MNVRIIKIIYEFSYFAIVINSCNISLRRYNVQWYAAPLHIQKTMLFLLQRGTKTFTLILGGIFVASLESAASVKSSLFIEICLIY